ncbi:MAG: hypothetical protein NC923_02065 [Candidatus Omnitrophica bacterium]|nr:hypothetical protein [Candidatus Omnitrophota bacterium]
MEELRIKRKLKDKVNGFLQGLNQIYADELVSVIVYGSAASGEFVERHSNLNLLVVLKDSSIENIKKASELVARYRMLSPLFMGETDIATSTDVFPIEFLDMRENYLLLYGKDILKDLQIDTKNLRFQCEHELKAKLISLRQMYLRTRGNKDWLHNLLLKSFTSVLYIARNLLRIKGKLPVYKKEELLDEVAAEFCIELETWKKILQARNRQIRLSGSETETLFIAFTKDLEKIAESVDKL